jgi:hypothetical protein
MHVKSGCHEIYHIFREERIWAAFNIYIYICLINITWILMMSWKNDMDMMQTYSYSCTTRLMITSSEVNNGFSLRAIYKGASVIIGCQERAFKPTKTMESMMMALNLSMPHW